MARTKAKTVLPKRRGRPPKKVKGKNVKVRDDDGRKGGNQRYIPIRLATYAAAREFGKNQRTFVQFANRKGLIPDENGKWSIPDCIKICFGDKDEAVLRQEVAKADKLERENRRANGDLIPVEAVRPLFQSLLGEVRTALVALDTTDRKLILKVLDNIADADLSNLEVPDYIEQDEEV